MKKEHPKLQKVRGIISVISRIFEIKDPYTAGHQRRVAELARALANEVGLPELQVKEIYIAGLLHDLGKVAVPAEILNKQGQLTQNEYNLVKVHPQAGYEIIHRTGFPSFITKGILEHHERLDGSGYPAGLFSQDITLAGKILAVADVVEAMSSFRPYRPAPGLDYALRFISLERDVLFDSQVVDCCLSYFEKNGHNFKKLTDMANRNKFAIPASW